MGSPTISAELSVEKLDQYAWDVICNWSEHTTVPVIHDAFNYSELTRFFLWDKVGRSIRRQTDPEGFSFEEKLIDHSGQPNGLHNCRVTNSSGNGAVGQDRSILRNMLLHVGLGWNRYLKKAKNIYVPCPSSRLENAVTALRKNRLMAVLDPSFQTDKHARSYQLKVRSTAEPPDLGYAERLFQGIKEGLAAQGIELLTSDAERLRNQIVEQAQQLNVAKAELSAIRPDGVLMHGDNHPPHQEYVLAARRFGIVSFMLQHGLDCEHFYHDDAYASAIALWGKARLHRYQKNSHKQPDSMQITGNPQYDHLRLPAKINTNGQYWLWVTRPHMPEKCYAPSRRPKEGIEICQALLSALASVPSAKLVIKPHPYDYAMLYQDYVVQSGVADRVTILSSDVQAVIPGAKTVICEDSTAGMEAMFWGKVVIHVHFAKSLPTMPFVAYEAALPAFSPEMLQESLIKAESLMPHNCGNMIEGQREFIKDHAGPCDGKAAQRVVSFINDVFVDSAV
jgi:hypothetical protein